MVTGLAYVCLALLGPALRFSKTLSASIRAPAPSAGVLPVLPLCLPGKVNSRHLVDVSGSPCGFVRAHQLSSGAQGLFSGLSDVLFSEVPSHVFLKNV